jgi:Mn2+/Fe2+ NRAMP family transporter
LAALRVAGPGLVTGASDDDPSGIATYAEAGARYGFGLLWSALITLPLMAAVQEICDRTALATGKTLGELAPRSASRGGAAGCRVLLVARWQRRTCSQDCDVCPAHEGCRVSCPTS